jgi:hypothetical protein
MSDYKTFDWKYAVEYHTTATVNFLWNNHKQPMSEEEFVALYKALPHDHPKAARCRSKAKRQYHRLKERFGFFTGELA